MQTQLKKLPHSEVLITIEADEATIAAFEDKAAARISNVREISGFRKGQAPKYIVVSTVGPQAFFQEVLNVALPHLYFDAVKEHKLAVACPPSIKIISEKPLKFEAHVATVPEVKLSGVEKLSIPNEQVEITDKEVETVIEEMRRANATYAPLDRPVEKGDRVEIDFEGVDEGGAKLEKASSKSHPMVVGEGMFIPAFEEQLVGMQAGKTKTFPVTFPKDFHYEPFKNKKVTFSVTLNKAELPVLPELTPEFVEKVLGVKKELNEFREVLKRDLHVRKQADARRAQENKLFETLLEKAKVDVPPLLIDEEVKTMVAQLKEDIEGRGSNFEQFMETLKKKGKDPVKEYRPEAEKRVKLRLVIHHLIQTLPIEVSETEMQQACSHLLESVSADQKQEIAKQLSEKQGIYLRLKNNMLIEKLVERFLK